MKFRIFFLLFPLLCLAGCHKTEEGPEPNRITDEQAIEFSQTIEKTLKAGDSNPFIRAVNWSSLTDRVLAGIPEKDRERFDRRYLIQLFSGKDSLVQSIVQKVKAGGSYHFLRLRKLDDQTFVATFRLVDLDGGLDYHDLYLARRGENLVQIEDFYLYHFGETFSESLRRTLVPELYFEGVKDFGMTLTENMQILIRENTELISELTKAYETKNIQRSLDLYDQLPEELRRLKTIQFWRLEMAQNHPDPSVYVFVLADVRKLFEKEAWADFLSLDYFFNRGEFQNALVCLDRIDSLVGGDPYLESFRCWAFLNLKNEEEAQKHLNAGLEKEPDLAEDPSFKSLGKRLETMKRKPLNPFEKQ
ncbi:MAG: hypothetical protein K6C40_12540 [Thermoguttaceae bacterium]|nr:hypothetical protein [Thermoguttaceae bacterium]